MMRVLLLTDADVFAGTERHILSLANGLRGDGLSVAIGCPAPSPLAQRAAAARVEVIPIAKKGRVDWTAIRSLRNLLMSGRIDLLHAHNGRTTLSAVMAIRAAGRGACVATQHFLAPDHVRRSGIEGWVFRRSHRWVNQSVDQFIAISGAVRDAMLARGDAGEDRITTIANAISDPKSELVRPSDAIRDELRTPSNCRLIVCVARLQPEKDVATLIRAMRHLADQKSDARCVIVGDGVERSHLQTLIESEGLLDRVTLAGFRDDAASIIAAGDVLVLPSPAEPFGLVLLEAMALGKPVIAIRAGGPLEIVQDGVNGLLVDPRDPGMLAEAIMRLLNDPPVLTSMGLSGRKIFEERFSVDRMAEETLAVYAKALSSRGIAAA